MSANPQNTDHIGDGVYATFDGYGIEIRVNDHRNPIAVYIEPDVLRSLVRFYESRVEAAKEAEESAVGQTDINLNLP